MKDDYMYLAVNATHVIGLSLNEESEPEIINQFSVIIMSPKTRIFLQEKTTQTSVDIFSIRIYL